jgi:hypothetical protein
MEFLGKIRRFIFLDYANYPVIELSEYIIGTQINNINILSKIRLKIFSIILVLIIVNNVFYIEVGNEILLERVGLNENYLVFFNMLCLLFFMFQLMKLKCPNCKTIPVGRSLDLSSGVAYSKGVNPFAGRCHCCGFYLRKGLLLRDMKKKADIEFKAK